MPIIASAGNKSEFEPCPEGPQVAVCCDVIDLGIVEVPWQGETKRQHKCEIRWQSAELMGNGKPYLLRERFTLSLHEKANLRHHLEAWRGRKCHEEDTAPVSHRLLRLAYLTVIRARQARRIAARQLRDANRRYKERREYFERLEAKWMS